jgi:hypothetical protein
MTRSVTTGILFSAWLAAALAWADESTVRRYELPNHDTLELSMPAGWSDHFEEPLGGGTPTIEIAVADNGSRPVFVRPVWDDPTAQDVRALPHLRDAVRDLAERIQPEAVENYLEVRHIAGTNGVGFYFTATDRNPGPEEFKFMSQGALQAGGLTLWFTILTNEGQDTVAVEALAMLQGAVHRRTGHDQL